MPKAPSKRSLSATSAAKGRRSKRSLSDGAAERSKSEARAERSQFPPPDLVGTLRVGALLVGLGFETGLVAGRLFGRGGTGFETFLGGGGVLCLVFLGVGVLLGVDGIFSIFEGDSVRVSGTFLVFVAGVSIVPSFVVEPGFFLFAGLASSVG